MMDDLARCREMLEISSDASWEEVQRAYHELVKVWHPDRFASDRKVQERAERKLAMINAAYRRLQQEHSRQLSQGPPRSPGQTTPTGNKGSPGTAAETAQRPAGPRFRFGNWPLAFSNTYLRHSGGVSSPRVRAALLTALAGVLGIAGCLYISHFLLLLHNGFAPVLDRALSGSSRPSDVPQFGTTGAINLPPIVRRQFACPGEP
jgi:curved DNA-binding protein CbpA